MLQRWVDHNGEEHRVLDDYQRNVTLIDLTAQPEDIKDKITGTIQESIDAEKNISQVGVRLMKFCHLYDLKKISDQAQAYAEPLNARYTV
jgi:endonuclease IV